MKRFACAVACVVLAACSLVSNTSPAQCETDADCFARGAAFAKTRCAANKTCVSDAAPARCVSHLQCTTSAGAGLCRADGVCAPILSPECPTMTGSLGTDGILIGSVFAASGANAAAGKVRTQSVRVALDELTANAVGVPLNGKPRALAVLECDESADLTRIGAHLVNELGVPAILGAGTSAATIDLATRSAIPGGTLVISPSATSATLTGLLDNGLVWRTAPSDTLQVLAYVDQLSAAEVSVRALHGIAPDAPVRLSVIYKDDTYGKGFAGALASQAKVNGHALGDPFNQSSVQVQAYNPDGSTLASNVVAVAGFDPSIVLVVGTTEVIEGFLVPLENRLQTDGKHPHFVVSDGVRRPELLALIKRVPALRGHMRGTIPGSPIATPTSLAFGLLYQSKYQSKPTVFGAAGAYDSLYLTAYAMAAQNTETLRGADLASTLKRVSDPNGLAVEVGGAGLGPAFAHLATGAAIRLRGASGPLRFDWSTGDAHADIDVWCASLDATSEPVFVSAGRYYDAESGTMQGAFSDSLCGVQ
jgi:branched-chain amino acid transport system substrate-binding protein